jgi:hypothetical protein
VWTSAERHNDQLLFRQLLALRLYLRDTLWDCGTRWSAEADRTTNYLTLVNRIRDWQRFTDADVVLVTFNYDTLLEQACESVLGWNFASVSSYLDFPKWLILKPHGSVDWGIQIRGARPGASEQEALRVLIGDAEQLFHLDMSIRQYDKLTSRSVLFRNTIYLPAIAIPLGTKAYFECPPSHLQTFSDSLSAVTRILVIGWRGDEPKFMERFRGILQSAVQIQIVDKGTGQETLENVQNGLVLRLASVSRFDDGFSAFLRSMQLEGFLLSELTV